MYKILGSDGREYGPATVEQLRQWMAEGRINAQTLARLESSAEWKPLWTFPELSSPTAPPIPPQPPGPPYGWQAADPRKSRIAAGILGIFLGGLGIHRFYLGYTSIGIAQIIVTIVTCGVGHFWGVIEGILILVGASITTDADGRPLRD